MQSKKLENIQCMFSIAIRVSSLSCLVNLEMPPKLLYNFLCLLTDAMFCRHHRLFQSHHTCSLLHFCVVRWTIFFSLVR